MEAENTVLTKEADMPEINGIDQINQTDENAQENSANVSEDTQAELESLREQVKKLTEELQARAAFADKIAAQLGEFGELFPDVAMESVPESVWESVRSGSTLASAYAIYARRAYMRENWTGQFYPNVAWSATARSSLRQAWAWLWNSDWNWCPHSL